LAEELNLAPYVTFHGFLPQPKIRSFYQAADLFVLTSRHEAGPVAVLEAAACGVPTVGTRVGHLADWDGREGMAVPVANPTALAEAILALLHDESRRAMMGRAALQWAKHYSADFTARRFEEIFTTLISNPRSIGAQGYGGVGRGVPLDH
jgi:glycosyltransferase involved in cell wall biosynthesis